MGRFGGLKRLFDRRSTKPDQWKQDGQSTATVEILPAATDTDDRITQPPQPAQDEEVKAGSQVDVEDVGIAIWNEAYEALAARDETAGLVRSYEKVLTSQSRDSTIHVGNSKEGLKDPCSNASAQERIRFMKAAVERSFRGRDRLASVQHGAEYAVALVDGLNKRVNQLLQAYPPAALAFAGLCVTIPLLAKPITENGAMYDGLFHVVDRMEWYMAISRLTLRENWRDEKDFVKMRELVRRKIQSLYEALLEYEIHCVCACESFWETFAKDAVCWNDWGGKLEQIRAIESDVERCSQQYHSERTVQYLSDAVGHLDSISRSLLWMSQNQAREARERQRERRSRLIDRFATAETCPYLERMRLNPDRIPGTCEWLQEDDEFRKWLFDSDRPFRSIVLSAGPGCGKSVLSRHLVEGVLPTASPKSTMAYFFFKDMTSQNTVTGALCALIHQLLLQNMSIVDIVSEGIEASGAYLITSKERLWEIFSIVASSIPDKDVVILLDALDECESSDLDFLTKKLGQFCKKLSIENGPRGTSGYVFRLLLTTRGFPHILDQAKRVGSSVHIEIDCPERTEKIQSDIQLVVEHKFNALLDAMKIDGTETKEMIWNFLKQKGEGQRTYLWVSLMFKILEIGPRRGSRNRAGWAKLLQDPPHNVYGAYEKLLQNVNPEDMTLVRRMLHILYDGGGLTVQEMQLAIHVWDHVGDIYTTEDLELSKVDDFQEWIIEACGFFVTIHQGRLFFIHQTAKEFLTPRAKREFLPLEADIGNQFRGTIDSGRARTVGSECAIAYLSMAAFRDIRLFPRPCREYYKDIHDFRVALQDTEESLPISDAFPLLSWSSNWLTNRYDRMWQNDMDLPNIVRDIGAGFKPAYWRLWQKHNGEFHPWLRFLFSAERIRKYSCWILLGINPIALAVQFNHLDLFSLLAAQIGPGELTRPIARRNYTGPQYLIPRNPQYMLHWTISNGRHGMALALLKLGADPNQLADEMSPLIMALASDNSNFSMTRNLLQHGADTNPRSDNLRHSDLFFRNITRRAGAARFMLENRIMPIKYKNMSPIELFCSFDAQMNLETLRLLLEQGESLHGHCPSLLHALMRNDSRGEGIRDCIEFVLDEGIDIESQDDDGFTPLLRGVADGSKYVSFLLERGANAKARTGSRHSIFEWAIIRRRGVPMIKLLVDAGAPIELTNDENLLHIAARYGDDGEGPEVIRYLVEEHGFSVNKPDIRGQTPLHQAAMRGSCPEVIQGLIDLGASVDAVNKDGKTPLDVLEIFKPRVMEQVGKKQPEIIDIFERAGATGGTRAKELRDAISATLAKIDEEADDLYKGVEELDPAWQKALATFDKTIEEKVREEERALQSSKQG